MFYFEEYLKFRGISKSFSFYKSYKKLKGVLSEINRAYYVLFGSILLFATISSLFQNLAITILIMIIIIKIKTKKILILKIVILVNFNWL